MVSLQTNVTKQYLKKAFDFSIKYYLGPNKTKRNRTSGQIRGLGQIVDSFITGKVIELGVVDILKKNNPAKKCVADLQIYDSPKFDDPDIIAVTQNKKSRDPRVFIEIKNDEEDYRWTGLFVEQFETMKRHKLIKNDLKKMYIIYASIKSKSTSNGSEKDLFGVCLKEYFSNSKTFEKFSRPSDLYVNIEHVITGEELVANGDFFYKNKDSIYETDILRESNLPLITKQGLRKGAKRVTIRNGTLPLKKISKVPRQFGTFKIEGDVDAYSVNFRTSTSLYLKCNTDAVVSNKILGRFYLKHGKIYQVVIKNLMACGRNNLWIAKRNLDFVTKPAKRQILEISSKI